MTRRAADACRPHPASTNDFTNDATNDFTNDLKSKIQAFRRDESGFSSVAFAIMLTGVLMVAALAVDHSRMVAEKHREQRAMDAAILAASDYLGLPEQDTDGKAAAQAYYKANKKPGSTHELTNVQFDQEKGEVAASSAENIAMTLMRAFGYQQAKVAVASKVAKGNGSVEIALVLDNSGSMSSDMGTLKSSALSLLGQVFAGAEGTDKVRVGVVPFAASVNIGSGYAGAEWMDTDMQSSIHNQNVSEDRSRFQLFADMGATWSGCVEPRPAPFDTSDAPASSAAGDSFFVPMFAPDEPGPAGDPISGYNNSYLDDDGGSCTPYPRTCVTGFNSRGNCKRKSDGSSGWETTMLPNPDAQARTCKYKGATASGGTGPNRGCTTSSLLPLTATRSEVESAVNAMQANGFTNIAEGTMWGWRVLSPGAPFTEGRPYTNQDNAKYLIIMTDGENTYESADNHNRTKYSAFGYGEPYRSSTPKRLGTDMSNSALVSQMNAKTLAACTEAKAAGIAIFTIAFRAAATSATARNLLATCASEPQKALVATDGAGLLQAFKSIGKEISKLRIAG